MHKALLPKLVSVYVCSTVQLFLYMTHYKCFEQLLFYLYRTNSLIIHMYQNTIFWILTFSTFIIQFVWIYIGGPLIIIGHKEVWKKILYIIIFKPLHIIRKTPLHITIYKIIKEVYIDCQQSLLALIPAKYFHTHLNLTTLIIYIIVI